MPLATRTRHYVKPSSAALESFDKRELGGTYLFFLFFFFFGSLDLFHRSISRGTVSVYRILIRLARLSSWSGTSARLSKAGWVADRNPSLRRGTKEINESVVCAWHCYICTYIQVPVNNDATPSPRNNEGGERTRENPEKSWIRGGWRNDVPGNSKIIDFRKRKKEEERERKCEHGCRQARFFDKLYHLLPYASSFAVFVPFFL